MFQKNVKKKKIISNNVVAIVGKTKLLPAWISIFVVVIPV